MYSSVRPYGGDNMEFNGDYTGMVVTEIWTMPVSLNPGMLINCRRIGSTMRNFTGEIRSSTLTNIFYQYYTHFQRYWPNQIFTILNIQFGTQYGFK